MRVYTYVMLVLLLDAGVLLVGLPALFSARSYEAVGVGITVLVFVLPAINWAIYKHLVKGAQA